VNTFTLVLLGLLAIPVVAQELPVNLEQRVAEAEQLIGGRGGRKEIGKALFAIGNLQSPEAADALGRLMSELSSIDRGSAILALGMCHNDAAKNHLRKIVADSKHLPDRNTAARVLASEGDGLWLLKRFEKEKNAVVAASMLYAIVDSGLADINDEILKAAKHKSAPVRAAAFYGIAELKIFEGAKLVESGLKDSSLDSRSEAARACGLIGNAKSFKALIKALRGANNKDFMVTLGAALRHADNTQKIELIAAAALKEKKPEIQAILVDALASSAKHDPAAATKALVKMIGKKDKGIRLHAIRGLAAARPDGVMEMLVKQLKDSDHTIRNEAAWALSQLGDFGEEIETTLIAMCGNRHPEIRINACLALGGGGIDSSVDALIKCLVDESWAVRSASVEALTRRRNPRCLGALIDLIENEQSRVRVELGESLAQLTGMDFKENAMSWRSWLEDQGDGFALPSIEDAMKSLEEKRKKKFTGWDYTSYHGIPITAGNTVFILDISGSMNEILGGKNATGETRFQVFADAMKQAISSMPSSTRFNIVLFSSGTTLWHQESQSPSDESIASASEFLDKSLPFGGTNIYASLRTAMQVPDVQNIFLMTDGEPSVGITDTNRIVTDITRRNRDLRININTIAGGQAKAEFLADLAAANGGQAVDLREIK